MSHPSSMATCLAPVLFVASALFLSAGCSGGKFPVVEAKGKVVCDGQPVTVGSVTFAPVGESGETGKPATATVGADGTFVLTTNKPFDGAIVGKHNVTYVGSEGEEEEESEEEAPPEGSREERAKYFEKLKQRRAQAKTQYVQKGDMTVEVTEDGPNDFTIEVVRAGRR